MDRLSSQPPSLSQVPFPTAPPPRHKRRFPEGGRNRWKEARVSSLVRHPLSPAPFLLGLHTVFLGQTGLGGTGASNRRTSDRQGGSQPQAISRRTPLSGSSFWGAPHRLQDVMSRAVLKVPVAYIQTASGVCSPSHHHTQEPKPFT